MAPSRPNILLREDEYGMATSIKLIGSIEPQVGVVLQSRVSESFHANFKPVWIDTFLSSYDLSAATKSEDLPVFPLFGKNAKQNRLPRRTGRFPIFRALK